MKGAIITDDEYNVLLNIQLRNHTEDSICLIDKNYKTLWKDLDTNRYVCFRKGLSWFKDAILEEDIMPHEKQILDNLFKRFKV